MALQDFGEGQPVRNRRNMAIGMLMRCKNGGPTLIFEPRTASESTGERVKARTATQAKRRIRLLKIKRDSHNGALADESPSRVIGAAH